VRAAGCSAKGTDFDLAYKVVVGECFTEFVENAAIVDKLTKTINRFNIFYLLLLIWLINVTVNECTRVF
jgi:hypothetical protein